MLDSNLVCRLPGQWLVAAHQRLITAFPVATERNDDGTTLVWAFCDRPDALVYV
jgi:hypothetical protein